jgi:hypothetical protein
LNLYARLVPELVDVLSWLFDGNDGALHLDSLAESRFTLILRQSRGANFASIIRWCCGTHFASL